MNKIKQTLIGMGLSVPLVLSATYLTAPSEGLVLGTYKDPVGIITSCYGHTGKELSMRMKFSEEECARQLGEDLLLHDKQLSQVVEVEYQSPYMHAALVDFTYNVGIGNMQPVGDGGAWWLQYENSDPTSADYGKSLGANPRNQSGMPSAGKWLVGMRVMDRTASISGTAGSQYVSLGYVRLTTGTGHVLNTDWAQMRCLTGT